MDEALIMAAQCLANQCNTTGLLCEVCERLCICVRITEYCSTAARPGIEQAGCITQHDICRLSESGLREALRE